MSNNIKSREPMWLEMQGVREYSEEFPVALSGDNGRLVVVARNQGGHDSTSIDLLDLLDWIGDREADLQGWITEAQGDAR